MNFVDRISLEHLITGSSSPMALSARNTLWPNSTGVRTLPRLMRSRCAARTQHEATESFTPSEIALCLQNGRLRRFDN
jgi:hypothetical protein